MKTIRALLIISHLIFGSFEFLFAQCPDPLQFSPEYVSSDAIQVTWFGDTSITVNYSVRLRAKGTSNWITQTTYNNAYTFTGLISCTEYELQVQALCSSSNSIWTTPILQVKTSGCLPTPAELKLDISGVSTGDKVYIRWIPLDLTSMRWGATYGYQLTRTKIRQADTSLNAFESFDSKIIIDPYVIPIQDTTYWINLYNHDDMAGVAAGALFGSEMELQSLDSVDLMTVVNLNKNEETQFGMGLFAADANFSLANDMGLGFIDTNVVAGDEYIYTINFNNVDTSTKSKVASFIIQPTDTFSLISIKDFKGRGGDSLAYLSWDNLSVSDLYTSFMVERSDDGGVNFHSVSDKPILYTSNNSEIPNRIFFTDILPDNTNTYIFRVQGKSPYGLFSPLSDTIHVKGRPGPIPIAPDLTGIAENSPGQLTISWTFDSTFINKIRGFDVYRAKSRDDLFVKINQDLLPIHSTSWVDEAPNPVNYYQIRVIDINNYIIPSLSLIGQIADSIPPLPPQNLSGDINDQGMMKLNWSKSISDDVLGYRVYYSNQNNLLEFVQITETYITDTIYYYQIPLDILNEDVFIGVKAVDYHENSSEMSSVLTLQRPDKIPPSVPVLSNVNANFNSINLTWEPSSSTDVEFHRLERKIKGLSGWQILLTIEKANTANITHYEDFDVEVDFWYEYRLLAFDEAENVSSSEVVNARVINSGLREPIINFRGVKVTQSGNGTSGSNGSSDVVQLNWEYINHDDLGGFTIFRGTDTTDMRVFKTVTKTEARQMVTSTGSGRGYDYGYIDDDLNFLTFVRTSYQIPSTYNPASQGTVRNRTGITPPIVQTNRNNPNTQNFIHGQTGTSFNLYYQVMAVFIDGSTSPISNYVIIPIN